MAATKILITGGAGFIGYHLTKKLLTLDADVILFDAFINYCNPVESKHAQYQSDRLAEMAGRVSVIRGDIRDRGQIDRVLKEYAPVVIIHLASIPISKSANLFSEEAVQININGTANLLESVRTCGGIRRFVYVSSSCVYGDFQSDPAPENHQLCPIDIYGATKLSGEILTRGFGNRFGIEFSIVRPSGVYGPTDGNQRVTQIMLENAINGVPLIMHNGGSSRIDFTHVEDTACGIALAALHRAAAGETFNITCGEGKSVRDLVAVLRERFPNLTVTETGQDERRPERGGLDISKARTLLGYAPVYDLNSGINQYIDYLLAGSAGRNC